MLEEIVKRRAVRKYKINSVKKEDIIEIIKAAQFAPNAKGKRSWEFLVIQDKKLKEKIYNVLTPQDFIKEVPIIIVPVVNKEITIAPIQDLSVATENMLLQATNLGLASVWKNIMPERQDEIKKILGIPDNYMVINMIPVGYADEEVDPHSEKDFEENKIHWGEW
jgi:nitroreductase